MVIVAPTVPFHYVFSVSFIVVSNARIVLPLVALVHVLRNDYSIPLSSAVIQSDVQYNLSLSMIPWYHCTCAVSPLESELDLGRSGCLIGCSDNGRARRERGGHMECIALAQAERITQTGRQWWWAARGS